MRHTSGECFLLVLIILSYTMRVVVLCSLLRFVHETIYSHRFTVSDVTFDWAKLKQARDNYIRRLNGIYESKAELHKIFILIITYLQCMF